MKEYTIEITPISTFECYDIRTAKKKALELAKQTNEDVLVTCIHTPTYRQDWFTALTDGRFITDRKGFKGDN